MKKIILGLLVGIALGFAGSILAAPTRTGGSFNYSTGMGPTVSGGQTISSTWANTTFTDIQTGLTQSLSRYGDGGMEAPLQLVDGTAGAPATKFLSSTNTGIYYSSGPTFNISAGGGNVLACTSTGCVAPVDVAFSTTARFKSAGTTTRYTTVQAASGIASDYSVTLPSAPPAGTAWVVSTAYSLGDLVTNDGGKVYVCVTAGTSATGPTGTGTGTGTGAVFDYYAADYSQAVRMSPTGSLSGATISNVNQAFGTPTYPRDVAIKSYVDGWAATPALGTWTTFTVGQAGGGSTCTASSPAPAYRVYRGVVYLRGTITYTYAASATTCTLSALPAGARPGTAGSVFSLTGASTSGVTVSSGGAFTFPLGPVSSGSIYFAHSFPVEQ